MYTEFGSIITAAVTPFYNDGRLNLEAFRELLDHLASSGSDSVVICGTTGEGPTLTDDEKFQLWRTAIDEVGGRIPVIAGTGTNDTHHSAELTRAACEIGVDGVLVVTPYYNKPPRDGLVRHFTHVSRSCSVPIILYNIPGRVVINLEPDLIAELAQLDNVVALKQANPDMSQTSDIVSRAPDLALYAGNDDSLLPFLSLGALGGICVASHVVGTTMQDIVERYKSGDEAGAAELDASIQDVYEIVNTLTTNPIPIKAAMNLMGFNTGPPRLPLVEASGIETERIRAMLERHGLLNSTSSAS